MLYSITYQWASRTGDRTIEEEIIFKVLPLNSYAATYTFKNGEYFEEISLPLGIVRRTTLAAAENMLYQPRNIVNEMIHNKENLSICCFEVATYSFTYTNGDEEVVDFIRNENTYSTWYTFNDHTIPNPNANNSYKLESVNDCGQAAALAAIKRGRKQHVAYLKEHPESYTLWIENVLPVLEEETSLKYS